MKVKKYLAVALILSVMMTMIYVPQSSEAAQTLSQNEESISNKKTVTTDVDEFILAYEEKVAEQLEAQEAYSELRTLFDLSEQGCDIYPDDYAGAWYEDGTLFVGLSSFDEIHEYKEVLDEFSCVEYVEMDLSLNQLNKIRDDMYELIADDIEISYYYVDIKSNTIVFATSESQEAASDMFSNILDSSVSTLDLNVCGTMEIDESLFTIIEGGKFVEQASLHGGKGYALGSNPSIAVASVGVCGTIHDDDTDYEGFITCGHGMTVTGTDAKVYIDNVLYGSTFYTMFYNNCYGDWAAVKKTSSSFTNTNMIYGSSASFTRNITDTMDELSPGMTFMKYGEYGGYCEGTVEYVDISIPISDTITVNGYTLASLDSGTSFGGDSGGPYYTQNTGNSYNFVGVHAGVIEYENSEEVTLIFTPYKCFKTWFTPKTN